MTFEDWQKYIDSQFVDDIPQPSESHAPAPNIEGASELHAFVTTDVNNFAVSSPQDFVPRSVEVVEVHKG